MAAVSLLLIYAHSMEEASTSRSQTYHDYDSERSAAFAKAAATLVAVCFVLTMGLLIGPRPMKILSSNLLVLVLFLMLLEGATQLLGIHFPGVPRRGPQSRDLWVYDKSKGWFHVRNGEGEAPVTGPDRGVVRINSSGLRGTDLSRGKPAGVKRILVFGDSFVFGIGVDQENVFTTRLEHFLNARSDRNTHEVINMGVAGYATDQEFILLEELGMSLSPDVVVLVACDNDFLGNTQDFVYRRYYKPYFELDELGELRPKNIPVPLLNRTQQTKLFLGQESNVWNFIRSRKPVNRTFGRFVDLFQVAVPRASQMDQVEITTALMLAFAERVQAAGARFLITNTGHRGEMTPLFHALRPNLRRPGIYLLGLEETLQNARRDTPEGLWDFPHDIHWNRDAHRLAAEVISNYILSNGLLEEARR